MVVKYCLQYGHKNEFMFAHQKMAIGVGDVEVAYIKKRYEEFRELYPYIKFLIKPN